MVAVVVVHPVQSLTFHGNNGTSPQAVLTIRNSSTGRMVAFKLKNPDPSRFVLRPSQGLLRPNTMKSVVVSLRGNLAASDTFKIKSLFVDDDCFQQLRASNEDEADFEYVWATADKLSTATKELRCQSLGDSVGDVSPAALAAYGPAEIRQMTERVWAQLAQLIQEFPVDDVSESLSQQFNVALRSTDDHEEKAPAQAAAKTETRRRASSADDCVICFAGPRSAVCVPCGHVGACVECANKLEECFMCRQPIREVVKIFKV